MADLTNCKLGNHKLKDILRVGSFDHEQKIVRWCSICGSIVVDCDCDNRTYPGKYMKMKRPEIAIQNHIRTEPEEIITKPTKRKSLVVEISEFRKTDDPDGLGEHFKYSDFRVLLTQNLRIKKPAYDISKINETHTDVNNKISGCQEDDSNIEILSNPRLAQFIDDYDHITTEYNAIYIYGNNCVYPFLYLFMNSAKRYENNLILIEKSDKEYQRIEYIKTVERRSSKNMYFDVINCNEFFKRIRCE